MRKISLTDLVELKDQIVREAFPELSEVKIELHFEKSDDELMGYGELRGRGYYIDVDKVMRKAPLLAVEGGLAHELAHILVDFKMDPISRFFDQLSYERDKEYQTNDERKTDLLVVERGYGPQLLRYVRFHDKRYKHYAEEDGLTAKELKTLLRNKSST